MNTWRVICGDCRSALGALEAGSARTCVTSPPYWGLRDYGVEGQLGLEPTPDEYVAEMVEVFREVRRVLADDGTLWLNLGDSYCGAPNGNKPGDWSTSSLTNPARQERVNVKTPVNKRAAAWSSGGARTEATARRARESYRNDRAAVVASAHARAPGLKPKDLVGIPWRVAFALQADGWWLRSDIVWAKPNPMPESVTDRPTKAHEYLFLLAKSERYFYDAAAIREARTQDEDANGFRGGAYVGGATFNNAEGGKRARSGNKTRSMPAEYGRPDDHLARGVPWEDSDGKRNRRDVWTVATRPFPEAHFATFPEDLVLPCVLAGSPGGGLVLDPFSGAGTTGVVALKQGRDYLGIELNPAYVEMSRRRLAEANPLFSKEAA